MRPFFIKTVGDWVEMQYNSQKYFEKVGVVFGEGFMRLSAKMTTGYQDCFTDFLLFEYKPVFFYLKTGLEYFVEYNPENLDSQIIAEYKEIWQTQKSFVFEIKRTVNGEGVEMFTKDLGTIFVHDSDVFSDWRPGELVWARVATVSGKYYFVNDFVPTLTLLPGAKKEEVVKAMSVQQIATVLFSDKQLLLRNEKERNNFLEKVVADGINDIDNLEQKIKDDFEKIKKIFSGQAGDPEKIYKETKQDFEKIRKNLGIKNLFSLNTFDKWIEKTVEQNSDFVYKNLVNFVPENIWSMDENHEEYLEAGQKYISAYLNKQKLPKRFVHIAAFSWKEYQDLDTISYNLLRDQKYQQSKESYVRLLEKILREEVLYWPVFKVFANASIVFFMLGEFFMALGLVEASLRLNPKYEFAKILKKNFMKSVGTRKINSSLVGMFYNKSVFSNYEKFLQIQEVNFKQKIPKNIFKNR